MYGVAALVGLLIATAAGASLRFGLAYGLPVWVHDYLAWRHAHSHLMFFGWGTLGLMACIWHHLPTYTGRPLGRGVGVQMALMALFALLSFPAFLPNGYGITAIGAARLPLGSIVSGFNALLWTVFALLYWRETRHLARRPLPVRLWDWAILLLMVACAGAAGFVWMVVQDISDLVLRQMLLHVFLELTSTGWFTLALLGVLWARVGEEPAWRIGMPTMALAVCLAPAFFLGVAPVLVPPSVFWVSALANAGASVLLGMHVIGLWRARWHLDRLTRFGLVCLGVVAFIGVTLLWPGLWHWAANTPLRIFHLHLLLVGWLSSALLSEVSAGLGSAQWRGTAAVSLVWIAGVAALLLALLFLGLPSALRMGSVPFWLGVGAWSTLPLLAAILCWIGAARWRQGLGKAQEEHFVTAEGLGKQKAASRG